MEITHDYRTDSTTNGGCHCSTPRSQVTGASTADGSGYKKSKFDGYMHVCSYCSGTGRKVVLTRKLTHIEKGPTPNR